MTPAANLKMAEEEKRVDEEESLKILFPLWTEVPPCVKGEEGWIRRQSDP